VVNVRLIRRLSLHNTRASVGDLKAWRLARSRHSANRELAHAPERTESEGAISDRTDFSGSLVLRLWNIAGTGYSGVA
jgi:uncharacterized protein YigA (DUF484 family)